MRIRLYLTIFLATCSHMLHAQFYSTCAELSGIAAYQLTSGESLMPGVIPITYAGCPDCFPDCGALPSPRDYWMKIQTSANGILQVMSEDLYGLEIYEAQCLSSIPLQCLYVSMLTTKFLADYFVY